MSKKKVRRVYEGELNKPLPPFPTVLDEDHDDRKMAHDAAVQERIGLLFELYSIDAADPDAWRKLAFELMSVHVPGFQYVRPISDGDRLVEVVLNVEYLARKNGISKHQAFRALADSVPRLGTEEAIRSAYREVGKHPINSAISRFLERIEYAASDGEFLAALEASALPEVRELEPLTPARPGRPAKK